MKFTNRDLKHCLSLLLSLTVVLTTIVMPIKVKASTDDYTGSIINPNFKPQATVVKSDQGFTHPGIILSVDDLNRIQKMVRGGYEPWASTFDSFRTNPKATKTYKIQNLDSSGNPKYASWAVGNGQYEARGDADAAYAQTLMWYITGDTDYSAKALQILRAWYSSVTKPAGDILTGGMAVQKFCFAAEVLRYTPGSGWTDNDTIKFISFLNIVKPDTNAPSGFMNQGSIATMGYMSSAIFSDSSTDYAISINRATVGSEHNAPNRGFSISQQIKQVVDPVTGSNTSILVEMGRDQGHAQGDIGALGSLAQSAYVQSTKVTTSGAITTDGTGTDLFQFLNNRILTGASLTAKYNIGYDIIYPPTQVGTDVSPETYQKVSNNGRGNLSGVYALIYNHYKYVESISDNDANMKYLKQAINYMAPEGDSQDFSAYGTLLFTPEQAVTNLNNPKGAPKPINIPGYSENTKAYNRLQAANFSGVRGDSSGIIGTENFTDIDGSRAVISGIKTNFYAWYKDIDLGSVPLDEIVMRAASSSSVGCKVDIILLDNVEGIDYSNVTTANISAGLKIATVNCLATGWWSNYATTTAKLSTALTGKHSFAMIYYGSNNVYKFQANVDWFKFDNAFSKESNNAVDTDQMLNGAVKEDDHVNLTNGSAILYKSMDFDNGSGALLSNIATTAQGALEIRTGSPSGDLVGSYNIPNTNGIFQDIKRVSAVGKTIYGTNDIYIVYKGEGTLKLKTYKNFSLQLAYPQINGSDISCVYKGSANVVNSNGMTYTSANATESGTTIVFPSIDFGSGPNIMSFRVRSDKVTQISLSPDGITQFESITIPNTNGKWTSVDFDMSKAITKMVGTSIIFMKFTGDNATVDLDYIQFDPSNVAPIFNPSDVPNTVNIYAGANYSFKFDISDIDSTPPILEVQQLPEGASFDSNSGMFTWKPTDKNIGDNTVLFIANDGDATTVLKVNYVVYSGLDTLITQIEMPYDSSKTYAKISLYAYKNAANKVKSLRNLPNASDAKILSAIAELQIAVNNLVVVNIDPEAVDPLTHQINVSKIATVTASDRQWGSGTVLTKDQIGYLLFDSNPATAGDLNTRAGSYYTIDFKEGLSTILNEIKLMPRSGNVSQASKMDGLIIQGSNDNVNWTNLINPVSGSKMNTWIDIKDNQILSRNNYRYLKISNIDPNKGWSGNIAEVQIFGDYGDLAVIPALGVVSISSNNSVSYYAKAGNTVTLNFESNKALKTVTVTILGQTVTATSTDNINWTAIYKITDTDAIGVIPIKINYTDEKDVSGAEVIATTDGTSVSFSKGPEVLISANGKPLLDGTIFEDYQTLKLEFNIKDSLVGIANSEVNIDGKANLIDKSGLLRVNLNVAGKLGQHNIYIKALDNAGNIVEKTFAINVKTSIDSINNLIAIYANDNKLGQSIVSQLTHDLNQAQHHLDKDSNEQAIKFMNDAIKHLENKGLDKEIDSTAKDILILDAKELIILWQK